MMCDLRIKAPRRPYRWSAIALIACLSASCQFLGLDMYPPELQDVSADCDLPALVRQKTASTFNSVGRILQLSSGVTRLLFVMCYTTTGNVVMVLDPVDLSYRGHLAGGSGPFGVDALGEFHAGTSVFDALELDWSTASTSVPIAGYFGLIAWSEDELPNTLVRVGSGELQMLSSDLEWDSSIESSAAISADGYTNWHLLDAAASSIGTCRILLRRPDTGASFLVEHATPYGLCSSLGDMTYLFSSVSPTKMAADLKDAWILEGCIAGVKNDRDNRIDRFDFKGNVIDSHLIDSDWKEALYFEPTGERWYYYDTRIAKLRVLRTWW